MKILFLSIISLSSAQMSTYSNTDSSYKDSRCDGEFYRKGSFFTFFFWWKNKTELNAKDAQKV